jgi:hypothetical protein
MGLTMGVANCFKTLFQVADGLANNEQRTEMIQVLRDLQMANTELFEKFDDLRDKYEKEKEKADSLQKCLDATIDWKKEREKYKLINIFGENDWQEKLFALTLKEPIPGEENPLLCPTCFENRKKAFLTSESYVSCPNCGILNGRQ